MYRLATLTTAILILLLSTVPSPVAADSHYPLFHDCGIDNAGNIPGCPVSREQVDDLDRRFTAGNSEFWATIENVEPGGDSKRPYVVWLYRNGFATNQEDDLDNVQWHDVNDSRVVLDALEEHSTCQLTADVASHGEFTVSTTVGDFTYDDEPDWERHAKDLMRSPVTVTATDIRIQNGQVQCRFDMAEILNRGMEVDGRFLEWSGRKPVIGDEIGSMGEISIQYDVGNEFQQSGSGNGTINDSVYVEGGHINVTSGNITVEQVGEKKEGEGWFESAVSGIMDVVGGDGITGGILRAITGIFMEFVRTVHQFIWTLLTWTPNVTGNPAVAHIHRLSLAVAALLAVLVLMAGGILYMLGPVAGVSYGNVRMILPRVVAALAFGAVSLPILQYGVELTQVLTQVFMPFDAMTLEGFLSYSAAAILVFIVDAVLLLFLVILFVMRGVYILMGAAVSPLLALGWAFPYTSRQSQRFISAWWAALAMAPADMIVLRFIVTLPQHGGDVAGTLGNWVYALAASFLLIAIPWQLYQASGMVTGVASNLAHSARSSFQRHGGMQRIADRAGYTEEYRRARRAVYGPRWEHRQELQDEYYEDWRTQREEREEEARERTPDHDRGFNSRRRG